MYMKRLRAWILCMGFWLGIHNGYIALWKDGADQPQIFPYRVEMLPEADQNRLRQGIYIQNRQELLRLMEDYLS